MNQDFSKVPFLSRMLEPLFGNPVYRLPFFFTSITLVLLVFSFFHRDGFPWRLLFLRYTRTSPNSCYFFCSIIMASVFYFLAFTTPQNGAAKKEMNVWGFLGARSDFCQKHEKIECECAIESTRDKSNKRTLFLIQACFLFVFVACAACRCDCNFCLVA